MSAPSAGHTPEHALTVVIPTHDRPRELETTLRALLAQEADPELTEIIVVSDGPSPTTRAVVEGVAPASRVAVRYFEQPKAGQGAARNVGIHQARGKIVLMLDDDITAGPGLLAAHLAAHDGRDDVIAVGALPVAPRDREPAHHRIVREWWESEQQRMAASSYAGGFRDFVTGNISVKRQNLLRVGGFDAAFTGYGREDYELGYRLSRCGLRFVYVPSAVGTHRYQKEPLEWLRQFYSIGKADVLFARKHPEAVMRIMRLSSVPRMSWDARGVAWGERLVLLLGRHGGRTWAGAAARVQGAHYWNGVRDAASTAELTWLESVHKRIRQPDEPLRLAPASPSPEPMVPFPDNVRALASASMASRDSAVSVVIPVYNQSYFLGDAIASVRSQSHPALEILVVDDGSSDDSGRVAERAGARWIRQANRGLAAARNTGLLAARGEFVVFLDADDRLLPNALERGLECAAGATVPPAFVAGGYHIIDGEGTFVRPSGKPVVQQDHYLKLLESNFIAMHAAVMYHRETLSAVGGFDETLPACEDYDVYLRVARWLPIRCHDAIVAEYRLHADNMSHDNSLMLESVLRVLDRHRPVPGSDARFDQAYASGVTLYQNYYGEPLLLDLSKHMRDPRQWRTALRDATVLARRYPSGLIRHARGRLPFARRPSLAGREHA